MFRSMVLALLYASSNKQAELPKQMYFAPRPTTESCLNTNLDPWFQERGITHALALMSSTSAVAEVTVLTTARNLVLNQPGMIQDRELCQKRTQELYKAMDACQVSKRTQRSLARRFRGVN